MARSRGMRDFTGNRRLRDAWTWWRTLRDNRRRYRDLYGRRMHLVRPADAQRVDPPLQVPAPRRLAPRLTDKIEAKKFIAERVGEEYVIPTYWSGRTLPPLRVRRQWSRPYFIKAAHGCHQDVEVAADGTGAVGADRAQDRALAAQHLRRPGRRVAVRPASPAPDRRAADRGARGPSRRLQVLGLPGPRPLRALVHRPRPAVVRRADRGPRLERAVPVGLPADPRALPPTTRSRCRR